MNPPVLGPLTRALKSEAKWTDSYPAWPSYADECEQLLRFLDEKGQLNRFLPRLRSKKQQRDEALNEIRIAYFFTANGFPVVRWEPCDAPPKDVEFEISTGTETVYVEVKSPGWESELSDWEKREGRAKEEKYRDEIEGRCVSPEEVIRRTVEKALPKFSGTVPSLVAITDDCFVSLGDWGPIPLEMALTESSVAFGKGLFHDPKYSTVGGVFCFWVSAASAAVKFRFLFLQNPNALPTAALPPNLMQLLSPATQIA